MTDVPSYKPVIDFWFHQLSPKEWWKKDPKLDKKIGQLFGGLHAKAIQGELHHWRSSPHGRLAEVLLLDQFPRHMFRDQPQSFASDGLALVLAQEAVRQNMDHALSLTEKPFLYMPFMHSESAEIHEWAVELFSRPGLERNLDFELRHKEIIDRFGRYPHRNKILGRQSTAEELSFLNSPGSSF